MSKNEFICDCNIIHEDMVKDVIKDASFIYTNEKQDRVFYTGYLKNIDDRLTMVRSFGFKQLEKFEL